MTRGGFGIVSLLLALVLGGALWAMNASKAGPTSEPAQKAESQAQQVAATANFGAAATAACIWAAASGKLLVSSAFMAAFHGPPGRPDPGG